MTAVWLRGRTRKQQIAVARARQIPFCFAPLSFQQLPSHPLSQVPDPSLKGRSFSFIDPCAHVWRSLGAPCQGRKGGSVFALGGGSGKPSRRRENEG